MSDEDGECLCCLGAIAFYVILCAIGCAIDEYDWEPVVCVIVAIATIIVAISVSYKIWEDTYEEKAFIEIGFVWFISIFVLSLIIDLWLMEYDERGFALFLLSLFLNLPGTCILIGFGAKKAKSDADRYPNLVKGHAKTIICFGFFWFIFWLISSAIVGSDTPNPEFVFFVFLLFVTIPGAVTIITFGRRLSKVIGEGLEIYGPTPPTVRYGSYSIGNINDVPEHAVCPYCSLNIRESFYKFNGVVRCPNCGTFHHTDCFRYGCGNPACKFRKS